MAKMITTLTVFVILLATVTFISQVRITGIQERQSRICGYLYGEASNTRDSAEVSRACD